jgi:hypothetical protein
VSAGTAAPSTDFMKQDPCGDGYIQGVDLAEKGDGEKNIAVLSHQRPHPLAFAAHDEAHVALEADGTQILVRPGIGAVDPESIFFKKFDCLDDIDDPGHRDVTGGAGGGFDDGGGDPGGTVPGDDDPVYTEAVSRADEGAKVLGILYPVEQKDEASGKGGVTVYDDLLETRVGKLPAETQHTLMGCRAGLAVEGLALADFHFDSPDRSKLEYPLHILSTTSFGDDDLSDVAALAPEDLQNGIDAVDDLHKKVTSDR